MRKKFLLCTLFAAFAAGLFLTGCSTDKPAEPGKKLTDFDRMPKRVGKKTLQRIPTDMCTLKIPYDITVAAGKPLELNVFLIYHGRKKLEIKEWYMLDQYNFEIHYRRKTPGKITGNDTVPFQSCRIRPPKGSDPNRSGLILHRDNQAVLSVNLPFIAELKPGEKALFEVYLSTTLRTFKISSNRMLIRTR